jgi:hypothetical protein
MSFDSEPRAAAPASLSIQFVNIEVAPLLGGKFSVLMRATLLDEEALEFVGEDLASAHVETLDEALAVIRQNVAVLNVNV